MLKNFRQFNEHRHHDFDENTSIFYTNKYNILPPEDIKDDKEKVIEYFTDLYGNSLTLVKVATYKDLDEYCDYNGVTKSFILTTIKEYLKV